MKYKRTEEQIAIIADFLYKYRQKYNLNGNDKEDWKHAERILVDLQTEDMLRKEYGKVVS